MRKSAFFTVLSGGIFLFSGMAAAAEQHVPSEYSTIQAAINDCNNGDTVIVEPGLYFGAGNRDLDFLGKAITVRSTNPEDPCVVTATVIDCQNVLGHRGFYFHSGEGPNSVVSGFTIKRGNFGGQGGGIYCSGSSPIIKNCIITNNQSFGLSGTEENPDGQNAYGGGIYCTSNAFPTIIECSINNNKAEGGNGYDNADPASGNGGGGYGGGICCRLNSQPNIISCTVSDNTAKGGKGGNYYSDWSPGGYGGQGSGGGIFCDTNSVLQIEQCVISGNIAFGGNGGYGENAWYFASGGNGGHGFGGGIYINTDSNSVIENCSYANNTASGGNGGDATGFEWSGGGNGGTGVGGGIYIRSESNAVLKNCMFTGNAASGGNGGSATVINSGEGGNGGGAGGAGIYSWSITVNINNCSLSNNVSTGGDGGEPGGNNGSEYGGGIYGNITISNCILWGDTPEEIYGGVPVATYSNIQGGWAGVGNINIDPCFADPV